MRRMHLMELEDQQWFPSTIRNCMTDLLNFQITYFQIYDPIVPILYKALTKTKDQEILDLCAGGAGSSRRVQEILQKQYNYETTIKLSDLYPNTNALKRIEELLDPRITYIPTSIDASKTPRDLEGFRTLFTSFHHFAPKAARAILQDAVKNERGIAIFELSERSLQGILLAILSFILVFLVTPFLRPLCLQRLFFTYAIPIVPLAYLFDGVVSQMRSYTKKELLQMAQEVDTNYHWEAGTKTHPYLPLRISYLVGFKR